MNNLEKKIMFSRGYVNFTTWAEKPNEPPPPGYEYVPYVTPFGNKRWKLGKSKKSDDLLKDHGANAVKALLSAGVQPGTMGNVISTVAGQVVDEIAK